MTQASSDSAATEGARPGSTGGLLGTVSRIVGALDLLLASILAVFQWAAMVCAPAAYQASSTEPEDLVGVVVWSAFLVPAILSAGVSGLILLRRRTTASVTPRAASWLCVGLAVPSAAMWVGSIAAGDRELRIAMVLPTGLFVLSAWLLRRMDGAVP